MLNNRHPVPAPYFGGDLCVPKNSDEKGFVGLEIFWEVSKSVTFSTTLSESCSERYKSLAGGPL